MLHRTTFAVLALTLAGCAALLGVEEVAPDDEDRPLHMVPVDGEGGGGGGGGDAGNGNGNGNGGDDDDD